MALDLGRASPQPLGSGGAARGEQPGSAGPSGASGTACKKLLRNYSYSRSFNDDSGIFKSCGGFCI